MNDVEHGVRTMLARRAGDVAPEPPPWQELVDRGPVLGTLPLREPGRRRPVLATAAVLVVLAGVAAAVVSAADRPATVGTGPAAVAQPAGEAAPPFDPQVAPPVWPVGDDGTVAGWFADVEAGDDLPAVVTSAEGAAAAYLAGAVGVPAVIGDGVVDETAGQASFAWSFSEDPDGSGAEAGVPATSGRVYLRRLPTVAGAAWSVVGSVDHELAVAAERTAEGVDVTVTAAGPVDSLSVLVAAGGHPRPVGGASLPQGGTPDPALGELFEVPATVHVPVDAGEPAVVRVRQVGGTFLSVAELAVEPFGPGPGAVPEPAGPVAEPADEPAAAAAAALTGLELDATSLGEAVVEGDRAQVPWAGGSVTLARVAGAWAAVAVVANGVEVGTAGDGLSVALARPGVATVSAGDGEAGVVLPGAGIPLPVGLDAVAPGEVVVVRVTWFDEAAPPTAAAFTMP